MKQEIIQSELNECCNLKKALENYFEKRIGIEYVNGEFDKLILYLDNLYKLSDIYDFDVNLVVDKEHHNKYYRFDYNIGNAENDFDTTTYIYFIFNGINSKNLGIVFDEITIDERDYPYGRITTYFLDGNIESRYYDYNEAIDVEEGDSYLRKLVKK